eukprot:1188684-Prorocentrum_minimum.AAC.4
MTGSVLDYTHVLVIVAAERGTPPGGVTPRRYNLPINSCKTCLLLWFLTTRTAPEAEAEAAEAAAEGAGAGTRRGAVGDWRSAASSFRDSRKRPPASDPPKPTNSTRQRRTSLPPATRNLRRKGASVGIRRRVRPTRKQKQSSSELLVNNKSFY